MNISYIANIRIPTEKAHGLQIMKTCEAISKSGHNIQLIVPSRNNHIKNDPFDFYKVDRVFEIKKIPVIDLIKFGKIGYLFGTFVFSLKSFFFLLKKKDVIYSRNILSILFFVFFSNKKVFFEAHEGRDNFLTKIMLKKVSGIVAITNGLKQFYISLGINASKIIVAPDAVDMSFFENLPEKEVCRKSTGLPLDKKIVMYVGSFSLYAWKGLDVFLESAKLLPEFVFVAIGGTNKEIENLKKDVLAKNVVLVERVSNFEIPKYLVSADVLVLPNKKGDIVSEKFTSPMKLFEYMASGVPIVASNLPSIVEILNENNSFLVEPNNPEAFAKFISLACGEKGLSVAILAKKEVTQKYSWQNRAKIILDFIKIYV